MRRIFAVIVALSPALALAQTAASGAVIGFQQNDLQDQNIGRDQCAGTRPVKLEWTIAPTSGVFSQLGTYRIVVSNKAPPTTGTNTADLGFCAEQDDPSNGIKADVLRDTPDALTRNQQATVKGEEIAEKLGFDCASSGDTNFHVCVHWYNNSGQKIGKASGQFTFTQSTPNAPTLDGVSTGDGALNVSWSAPSGTAPLQYQVTATNPTDPADVHTTYTTARSIRLGGLTNGTTYGVVVFALGRGGNASAASNTRSGTPSQVEDFFGTYRRLGGAEEGGCAGGPAGLLSLLGVASFLALRRRSA